MKLRNINIAFIILIIATIIIQSCQEASVDGGYKNETQIPSPADMPLKPGTYWNYDVTDLLENEIIARLKVEVVSIVNINRPMNGGYDTTYTVALTQTFVPLNITLADSFFTLSSRLGTFLTFAGVNGDTVKASDVGLNSSSIAWMIFPLEKGKFWYSKYRTMPTPTNPSPAEWTVMTKVLERLNIMIGNKPYENAFRLQKKYYDKYNKDILLEVFEDFYPKVGMIALRMRQLKSRDLSTEYDYRLELKDYYITN